LTGCGCNDDCKYNDRTNDSRCFEEKKIVAVCSAKI
jgi:hypothetical protein